VRTRVDELSQWRDRASRELNEWLFDGIPLALGTAWPPRLRPEAPDAPAVLTHPRVWAPEDWPEEELSLELDLGGEGLVRVEYEDGPGESFGLDPWHRSFPVRHSAFEVWAEVVPRLPYGVRAPAPTLRVARLLREEAVMLSLHRKLELVAGAAAALGVEEESGAGLLRAAEHSLDQLRLPTGTFPYLSRAARSPRLGSLWRPPEPPGPPVPLDAEERRSAELAELVLESELARLKALHPPRGRLALAGHGHLDLAWLWPLEETRRKARRTFHTAVALLTRYPEMTFVQSSAELYELVRGDDPDLYRRIRELSSEGRWEPVGGMWVEPDMNMLSGESIVRQLLYGQRFFERELGGRHRVAWLPDCFGFSPALPQLLLGAGMDAMFTCKLNWSERNRFPYDLFWWEGLDGSRVLVHGFDNTSLDHGPALGDYNGDPEPDSLLAVWRRYRGKVVHPESLYTIGYGDGGGGPNRLMLDQVRDLSAFPSLPALSFSRVRDVFERLRRSAQAAGAPVWEGELYLELHRGTLTTQGRTKRLHRRAESALLAAEVVSSLARLMDAGPATTADGLGEAWRLLLRNQFHDILPGTAIGEVYERAEVELGQAAASAEETTGTALQALARALAVAGEEPALVVVNPCLSTRPLRLLLREPFPGTQQVEGGWAFSNGTGVAGLEVAIGVTGDDRRGPAGTLVAEGRRLENDLLRVELAEDGTLASVFDKRVSREVLAGPGNQLWAFVDRPRHWDAWDLDEGYESQGELLGLPSSIEVVEEGPHRAAIRLSRSFRSSRITQTVRLWAGSPRLEFHTLLDWHERRVLLQARFPLGVRSPWASFETAFGVLRRPTHRNTSWEQAMFEVAGHRFADLSEPGYGVAVLNDGRYGHHALGSELGLSLLRSPVYPDPEADEGLQEVTYALLPHPGSWLEGGVLMEAEDLNSPLLAIPWRAGADSRHRALEVGGIQLALGALKGAEDGRGLILRLYEPQGARGPTSIRLDEGWRVTEGVDLLEDPAGAPDLDFGPFQVRSYRLEA
jgi:alpha-mannosidase